MALCLLQSLNYKVIFITMNREGGDYVDHCERDTFDYR